VTRRVAGSAWRVGAWVVAVVVVVVAATVGFGTGSPDTPLPPLGSAGIGTADPVDGEGAAPVPGAVTVHVSGAVAAPGLVTLRGEARVADAVAAAGGATRNADLAAINLAAPIHDADHVHVPTLGDSGNPEGGPAGGGDGSGATSGGIDLNGATVAELEELPGVGPVLAERIAAYRDEHGPFAAVEDLLDVPGIGEGKLAMLRDSVAAP
jgi:competence protein ComEA